MEFLLEALFQIVGEFLLQILFESAVELGFSCFQKSRKEPLHPTIAMCGFLAFGALAGVVSLWPFPNSFIADHNLRLVNLLAMPLAAAGLMALVGRVKQRFGKVLVNLDRFVYALAFAYGMALVRFFFAAQW